MRQCQAGDSAAFAELYRRYHDRLHRFCAKRLSSREDAEDVAQESFLRAWRALPTFSGALRFYPWLTVIANHLCTDQARRRERRLGVGDSLADPDQTREMGDAVRPAWSSEVEDSVLATYDTEMVVTALERLSERHRRVLFLREEEDLSYREIARAEGVEISTIETLLWRARQALKREYAALTRTKVLGGLVLGFGAVRRMAARLVRKLVEHRPAGGPSAVRELAAAGVFALAFAASVGTPRIAPASANAPSRGPVHVTRTAESAPTSVWPTPQGAAASPPPSSPAAVGSPPPTAPGAPVQVGTTSSTTLNAGSSLPGSTASEPAPSGSGPSRPVGPLLSALVPPAQTALAGASQVLTQTGDGIATVVGATGVEPVLAPVVAPAVTAVTSVSQAVTGTAGQLLSGADAPQAGNAPLLGH